MNELFKESVLAELRRIDSQVSKRNEKVIERYDNSAPRAIIGGRAHVLFNSNDYLGLRFHTTLMAAEHEATRQFGVGPGGVRFICGTTRVHRELEHALARFHGREDALLFSSGFAANFGVLHALIKGQSKDALVSGSTLVISDELNHRSIIDGIRVAGLPPENKAVFKHLDLDDLERILALNAGKFTRVLLITDGVFSMLGEVQDLKRLTAVAKRHEHAYEQGIMTVVDDSHGVAALGKSGRGTEEVCEARCDILLATLGKGFGADGGYAVGPKFIIDYLRESAATYVYSNPISAGTAAAALAAVRTVESQEGIALLRKLEGNVLRFKQGVQGAGYVLAANSSHAVQPLLIGDANRAQRLAGALLERGFLVTCITYPVVPRGRDELRVQLNASHSEEDVAAFLQALHDVRRE